MTLVHDVGTHGRGRRLAMRTGYAKALVSLGQCAKHLSALLNLKTIILEIYEFFVLSRDCWCINNQAFLFLFAKMWNLIDVFFVMDEHTLLFQLAGKVGWCLVVTTHN